jgi:DNA ligase-1
MISGWAVDPNAIYRYQVDAAFPLSDHADYDDLLRYVELVQPTRVLTLHGFAAEFARDLRERGMEAWALSEENQMELTFGTFAGLSGSARVPRAGFGVPPKQSLPYACNPGESDDAGKVREGEDAFTSSRDACATRSEFATFSEVGESIAATAAKLEKIRLLAQYLVTLDDACLSIATVYFTGRAFAQTDLRTLQVGGSVIYRALSAAGGLTEAAFRRIAYSHGDAGKTAFEALDGRTNPEPFTLLESYSFFETLQKLRGPVAKTEYLQDRLARLSAREGQYLIKILSGDLRIGLREGLVEEAISTAFAVPLDEVKEANMLLGDIGRTAVLARNRELHRAELSLFRPIKCMLASPEPTAETIWKRFADSESATNKKPVASLARVYVEDKFDGIRAQVHATRGRAEIFSRDLKRITGQFPEIAEQARRFASSVILDGEIMAFAEGRKLTFFDLQKRLGRKNESGDLFDRASADVPVIFVAFDLLFQDGQSLLKTALRERRERLGALTLPPRFQISKVVPAHSAAEIEREFKQARLRLNEGLMVKDPESTYAPGTRGMFWFKLKQELATP